MTPKLKEAEHRLLGLKDETSLLAEQDVKDRQELVMRASPGFKPKGQGRKLELTLIPQKNIMRKGTSFWYRAEIKNVGTEPVRITDPFIKTGGGGDGWSKFRLKITPAAPDSAMVGFGSAGEPCVFEHPPVPGWDRLSDTEKKKATARWIQESTVLKGRVNIELLPGETLRTRDWRPSSREEDCAAEKAGRPAPDRPGGLFREHPLLGDFSKAGTYRVKLLLQDSGSSGSSKLREIMASNGDSPSEINALLDGRFSRPSISAESNELVIEVVP